MLQFLSNNQSKSDRWYKEGDPAHDDEHGGGQVDAEDVGTDGSGQFDLKAVDTVVTFQY